MYEHRVDFEGKWSTTGDTYSALKNYTETKNTIIYTAIGAIDSMMHWEMQMRIDSATHTDDHAILFMEETLKTEYLLVYYLLFGSEIADTITQPYLVNIKWNYFDTQNILLLATKPWKYIIFLALLALH